MIIIITTIKLMIIIIITITNNRSRKKCSFVKEGLIKLLSFLRFNRTCLKPRNNYVVVS